jgi:hypothetical protein
LKIRGLAGTERRILATFMALERSNYIIYDTTGLDFEGTERLNKIVREEISNRKGAAIEINVPTIKGKRLLPQADKLVELKMPSHNHV